MAYAIFSTRAPPTASVARLAHSGPFLPAVLSCAIPQAVHAQDEGMASRGVSETVDFITKLASIFWSWVDEFYRVADKEKRKQLIRIKDKLQIAVTAFYNRIGKEA